LQKQREANLSFSAVTACGSLQTNHDERELKEEKRMNFIKRGLQNLWAKKGRSILLIAVFSAILIFVLAGLTIQSAALVATENAQKSVGATVTLQANREALKQQRTASSDDEEETTAPSPGGFQTTPVNLSDAQAIAELDGVASYSFEVSTSADAVSGIEAISSEDSESTTTESADDSSTGMNGQGKGMPAMQGSGMSSGDFQVTGVFESATYSSFSEGTASIIEGEAITEEDTDSNNVLIESELAEANELTVGDTFTISDSDGNDVEVTIKGIYETSEVGSGMSQMFNFLNPANTLIASYTLANTLSGSEDTLDSATYTLSDPSEMDDFVAQAEELIDTDTYSIQSNDQMYQSMLTPLNNVASFAKNIVVLVAVAGVIILTLIVMLSIRERKYEIGVLLSLGESRGKVVMQFFTEIFICMVVALGIAAASGNVVGNIVGEQLLAQTSTEQASTNNEMGAPGDLPSMGNGGGPSGRSNFAGFTQSEEIQELDITVSFQEIGMLALLGLGISFGSILLSSVGILRLNPKKILIS
jgi:putative ABC transport system permease protein